MIEENEQETQIRPCPFCGGVGVYYPHICGKFCVIPQHICCQSCAGRMGSEDYKDREDVVLAWNSRVE